MYCPFKVHRKVLVFKGGSLDDIEKPHSRNEKTGNHKVMNHTVCVCVIVWMIWMESPEIQLKCLCKLSLNTENFPSSNIGVTFELMLITHIYYSDITPVTPVTNIFSASSLKWFSHQYQYQYYVIPVLPFCLGKRKNTVSI